MAIVNSRYIYIIKIPCISACGSFKVAALLRFLRLFFTWVNLPIFRCWVGISSDARSLPIDSLSASFMIKKHAPNIDETHLWNIQYVCKIFG